MFADKKCCKDKNGSKKECSFLQQKLQQQVSIQQMLTVQFQAKSSASSSASQ
jgi:hypothetical protein